MAEITGVKRYIDELEIKYRAAVSESTFTKIGAMINFLGRKTHEKKDFFLNGRYGVASTPALGVDGLCVFQFDAEIFAVYMFNHVAGSSGTTELDVKKQTTSGGAYSTIFSTTPKITSAAGNYARVGTGEVVAGCTAPVLTSTPLNVSAGEALRLDLISAQGGTPENCGIIVHFRPR
ncbi:MAG: hypothetical protein E6R04_08265 [Spirochaetes bacterium]|nr:MAG: hypothetical protein E6R04_08265 [Spirochaetota bacterium]